MTQLYLTPPQSKFSNNTAKQSFQPLELGLQNKASHYVRYDNRFCLYEQRFL